MSGVTAFFLFDVGEAINLDQVRRVIQTTSPSRLASRSAMPAYVQYQQPPLAVGGDSVGIEGVAGFRLRFKIFDYGVVSVALQRSFEGSWDALGAVAHTLHESPEIGRAHV